MVMNLVVGFLVFAALAAAPVVILHTSRNARVWSADARLFLIRVHCWPREPVRPEGPPLEELAATLRRLYPGAHHPRPGTRMPKQRGVLMAYDEHLVVTARALEVPTVLGQLDFDSFERECERTRIERALTAAGIVWQVLPPDRAA